MNIDKIYLSKKHAFENSREKFFLPVLKYFANKKIKPDDITIFRLIFIIPLVYFFYVENLPAAVISYLLFWFFDLLDGSLARYLKISHDKGRFLDSVVDNFAYCIGVIGFIYIQAAWAWLLALNIILEITAQILGVVVKRYGKPTDWLIKAQADLPYFKSLIHLSLFLYVVGVNILIPSFVLVNCGLGITAFYFLILIKNNK